jgi:hypothetical protein
MAVFEILVQTIVAVILISSYKKANCRKIIDRRMVAKLIAYIIW